jgi:glycosyltransferase involved in cell wall biosynthesis
LRIALYYPWIYLTSGAERVILEITGRSRHEWTLFTNHFDPAGTFPEFGDREVLELMRVSVNRSIASVVRAGWTIYRQSLPLEGFDALFVVCEGLGDLLLFRNHQLRSICYCLTPLRVAFDPAYYERTLKGSGVLRRFVLHFGIRLFQWIDRAAWRRYQHAIFISTEALHRARNGGLNPSGPAEVIWPGLGIMGSPSIVRERYFLVAGRIMWTKNIELAVRAFKLMKPHHPDFRLVVAGMVDAKSEGYLDELQRLAAADPSIEFVIAPSDAQLRALYERCYGLLFTPFNEDWGIVPLEAMSFAKPVIAVNRGGPVESIEHGRTGLLCPPEPQAFADLMSRLVEDPDYAAALGSAGAQAVQRYSWPAVVERIDTILESVRAQGPA